MRHPVVKSAVVMASLIALCTIAGAQDTSGWTRKEANDPLHKLDYSEFSLVGKYLVSPSAANAAPPVLVVRCTAGTYKDRRGTFNGKFIDAFISVDAVLVDRVPRSVSRRGSALGNGGVWAEYTLDGGKLHAEQWNGSTGGKAAYLPFIELNNLLYGHWMPHKENTGPAVRSVVVGLPEYLGGEIQMQFDLGDTKDVAEACGVIVHKK